jgi:hypothetical protein
MWGVDAGSECGSGVYTYLVDAPKDADEESVAVSAYAKHGQLLRDHMVEYPLGEVWAAFWRDTVTWNGSPTQD